MVASLTFYLYNSYRFVFYIACTAITIYFAAKYIEDYAKNTKAMAKQKKAEGLSPTGIESGFDLPVKRLSEQVRQMWGSEVTYKLTGKLEDVPVSQRSNIFKTLHQAVVNAARKGAEHIHVSIGKSRQTLKVLIMDDGKGFDVEREKQALGFVLAVMGSAIGLGNI